MDKPSQIFIITKKPKNTYFTASELIEKKQMMNYYGYGSTNYGKFLLACDNGWVDEVRKFIDAKDNFSHSEQEFVKAGFLYACRNGHFNVVKYLVGSVVTLKHLKISHMYYAGGNIDMYNYLIVLIKDLESEIKTQEREKNPLKCFGCDISMGTEINKTYCCSVLYCNICNIKHKINFTCCSCEKILERCNKKSQKLCIVCNGEICCSKYTLCSKNYICDKCNCSHQIVCNCGQKSDCSLSKLLDNCEYCNDKTIHKFNIEGGCCNQHGKKNAITITTCCKDVCKNAAIQNKFVGNNIIVCEGCEKTLCDKHHHLLHPLNKKYCKGCYQLKLRDT
jgi:hypothetical protein